MDTDSAWVVPDAVEAETVEEAVCTQEVPGMAEKGVTSCGDSWSCAICLDAIDFLDLAVVKRCEHTYCVHCILKWTCTKEGESLCPTCKAPFSSLLVHRQLDGSLTDFEVEEPVVLLARAVWFQDWMKLHERNKDFYKYPAFRSAASAEVDLPPDALERQELAEDAMYQYFEDEYEDDAVEDFYFSSRAGPSRVTFGNRPFGPNGFVRGGHRVARPANPAVPRASKGSKAAGPNGLPSGAPTRAGEAAAGEAPSKAQGRRARRNARRRAEEDVPGF